MVLEIDEGNFEKEVVESKAPVLIDFWASWCVPCRLMAPVVEGIAGEFAGRLKVGKVNVDENSELSTRLSILNIPTLILYKDGKEASRITGVNSKSSVSEKIRSVIGD